MIDGEISINPVFVVIWVVTTDIRSKIYSKSAFKGANNNVYKRPDYSWIDFPLQEKGGEKGIMRI
jgi:hypothetical protein